jgi:hypothetical protein
MSTAAATPAATVEEAGTPGAVRRSIHGSAGTVTALTAAEHREAAHGVGRLEAPLRPKYDLPPQVHHARRRKVITVTETPDAAIKVIATPTEESGAGEVLVWQRGGMRRRDDGDDGAPGARTDLPG